MKIFICTTLLVLTILEPITGLQCYVCNSAFSEGCEESPPPLEYLNICSRPKVRADGGEFKDDNSTYTFCRKSVTMISRQENKHSVREAEILTIRACGWIGPGEDVCKWGSSDGTQSLMCTCLKDKCNSSFKIGFVLGQIETSILAVALIKIFN